MSTLDMSSTASDARASLKQDAKSLNLVEFWEQRADVELLQPRNKARPYRWRWSDIEPRLRVASKTVPIEECERRALVFANPGLDGKPYITNTLFAAYSLYNPAERAPVHRHTPSASRFVLEGDGGFTVVEGEKLRMSRGDLILTPTGTWHDHGNDGAQPVIWVDVLNVPLVESLNATSFEFNYAEKDENSNTGEAIPRTLQTIREPDDHSQRLYGTGGIKPLFVSHRRGPTEHSPLFVYRWQETRAALEKLQSYAGSPYDGIIFEYVDPTTGGPVMPTMSFRSQMLRPGEQTLPHRKTASNVYCVLEGQGYTDVEGTRLEWQRNDVFTVPGWLWHEHRNTAAENAFLYSVTDEPTMRKLGLFREEGKTAAGKVQSLAA
jgi:gentisate 1,2-dioxygenase